jgi:hypothetical protein
VTTQHGERHVKYLLLLHGDPAAEAALSAAERRAIVDEHIRFSRELRESGAILIGEALEPPPAGRTIRMNGQEPMVTDGPFLEGKEALGGFYLLECGSLDEATDLASRVPGSPGLVAELLPIADV